MLVICPPVSDAAQASQIVLCPFEVPISRTRVRRLLRTRMLRNCAVCGSRLSTFLLCSCCCESWCCPAAYNSVKKVQMSTVSMAFPLYYSVLHAERLVVMQ